jgi:hypothetical protein
LQSYSYLAGGAETTRRLRGRGAAISFDLSVNVINAASAILLPAAAIIFSSSFFVARFS